MVKEENACATHARIFYIMETKCLYLKKLGLAAVYGRP